MSEALGPSPLALGGIKCCGAGDGHAGRGGLPHEFNLPQGQAIGLIDEVAERALQAQGFGGEGVGGVDGAGVFDQAPNEMGSNRRPALSHL
jgi:hypothetical protein